LISAITLGVLSATASDATDLQHDELKPLIWLNWNRFPKPQVACSRHAGIANISSAEFQVLSGSEPSAFSFLLPSVASNVSVKASNSCNPLPLPLRGTWLASQSIESLQRCSGQWVGQTIDRKPFHAGKGVRLTNFWCSSDDRRRIDRCNPPLACAAIEMINSANQAVKLDAYSELFIDFSHNGIFHAFIRFDFSTWESSVVLLRIPFSPDEKYLRLLHDRRSAA
jgi:hypothetical protein